MDAATRLFLVMIIVSLIVGAIVVGLKKDFNVDSIYESNKNYYPSVTEQSIKEKW